jgi:hypothetical protein
MKNTPTQAATEAAELPEVWAWVHGYEGLYQVSNFGRVKSETRGPKNPTTKNRRYLSVRLHKDGKAANHYVHRLVAKAFIPNPENLPQTNHRNGKRHDNHVSNLEWVTASQNTRHSFQVLGNRPAWGERSNFSKLTEKQVTKIRFRLKQGDKHRDIAKDFDVSRTTVGAINTGANWKYL